jgi:urease accessory protein
MQTERQDPPWRVVRAFPQANGAALAHLHNVSGGVLAGDRLSLAISVGRGAAAQVTTTGATRVYRRKAGAPASEQHTEITIAENGLLEHLPDPLIPFAGSRHVQRTTVALAEGATFFGWEVLAPGRQARGEIFAFESLRMETLVRSHSRPLVHENLSLDPRARPLDSPARLGGYLHAAGFYAVQAGRSASELRALESELNEIAREVSGAGSMIWGASALAADGVVVRGLSATARDLPATLVRFWNSARRFLTGENAVPPRKIP